MNDIQKNKMQKTERIVTFGGADDAQLMGAEDKATEDANTDAANADKAQSPISEEPSKLLRGRSVLKSPQGLLVLVVTVVVMLGSALAIATMQEKLFSQFNHLLSGDHSATESMLSGDEEGKTKASESASAGNEDKAGKDAAADSASVSTDTEGTSQKTSKQGEAADQGADITRVPSEEQNTATATFSTAPDEPSAPATNPPAGTTPPSTSQPELPQTPPVQTISIRIESSAADGSVNYQSTIEFKEGMTPFDALVATGISYNATPSAFGIYVSAIGGLAEMQYGPQSGWKYHINGIEPSIASSSYVLKPGDEVLWFYALTV